MLKELKGILSDRYQREYEHAYQQLRQIINYDNMTKTYIDPFTNRKHLCDIDVVEEKIVNYLNNYNNKSFFYKILNRLEFKKDLSKLEEELKTTKEKINKLVKPSYYEDKNIMESKINKLKKSIDDLDNCSTLSELNIEIDEAVKLLEENGRVFCLTEDDIDIATEKNRFYRQDKIYNDLSELILVHKTSFAPKGNVVRSNISSGAFFEKEFILDKARKTYKVTDFRNTIHFCLNGEVSSHAYGNFDGRKYAILQPLTDELAKKIKGFNPADTYFEKKVDLKGGFILCPIEESDQISKDNPLTMVVPYNGKSVDKYADTFLTLLGYQCEYVGSYSWMGESDIAPILKDKYCLEHVQHYSSDDRKSEESLQVNDRFNKFLDLIIDTIKEEGLNPFYVYHHFPRLIEENNAHIYSSHKAGKKNEFLKIDEAFGKGFFDLIDLPVLLNSMKFEEINTETSEFWKNVIIKDVDSYNKEDIIDKTNVSDLYRKILYVKRILGSDLIEYPVNELINAQKEYYNEKNLNRM